MKKITFLRNLLLAVIVLVGSQNAWAAQGDLIYTLDLAAQSSAFGTSNTYGAKSGTVSDVTWYANAASCQSTSAVWLGTNSATNRTNLTKLSAGVNDRGGAIATALGISTSDVGYYAIVASNAINNVGSIKVKASATGNTAPSTLWCLYTTDGGSTYTVLESKSSPGTTEQTFTPSSTIASAQYAFVFYSSAYGTYRTPYFKFYEGLTETSTPTILVSESSIPAMSAEVDNTDTETITVSGVNLEGNITLALSGDNADYFDLSTLSIAPADGTVTDVVVTITYAPEAAGSHTATLTLSSTNATDVIKTLTGTANWPPLAKPNATDASGIGQTGFTANWDAVAGATEYELSVYTKEEGDLAEFDYGFEGSISFPENWTGDGYVANGAANANTGTYYAGLNATPKYIRTDLVTNPSSVSFYYRYSSATANNTVKVQVSSNGTDWTDVGTPYVATGSGATITYVNSSIDLNLTGQYYIQWVMTARTGGSFYFDDVKIIAGSPDVQTPISGSPFTVTDGTSKAITGLTTSTTYYYTVKAANANVESAVSNEISVVTSFGTSTDNPSSLTSIYAHNAKIHFAATAGEKVEVYNAVGQKIISTLATDGQNELSVNAKGVMIVKVGSRLAKVIL